MNDITSDQVIDVSNLPANKKAKAIQKRRAAENSYEALQLKKSAAIYLRVSSEMQVDGFSIEAQKIACLKYAVEQGYEVTDSHIYIDEAYSAKNEDRPEFKRLMISVVQASASKVGKTISIEGYVDSAGKNSLYVSGKILVANEYSSISTGGTNIFVGDYVMGFIYLNEDMQSYTIVSLTKIPERSIGTPTPLPQSTATPVWADLFLPMPTESGDGLHLLSDGQSDQKSDLLWDSDLFGTAEPVPATVPTATTSSLSFEGVVSDVSGNRIVINEIEYVIDNATGYKDRNSEINQGDYVRGRAAPYPGALIIRYIEVLSDYERSDLDIRTVWGLYQFQDSSKMIVSLPDGDIEALFFPGTKMSKTFYTKGTLVSLDMAGSYVKSSADYPLVQSGDELTPINGIIDEIVRFSDDET